MSADSNSVSNSNSPNSEMSPSRAVGPDAQSISDTTWRAALKLLNESKWWFAPLASIVSIFLLAKYLWVVGHPELLLYTLGSPSTLFVWLAFAVLGFFSLLLALSVPSVFLIFSMSVAEVKERYRAKIAVRFFGLAMLNFIVFIAFVLISTTDTFIVWLPFLISFVITLLGLLYMSRRRFVAGAHVFRKRKTKEARKRGYRWERFSIVACLVWMTACTGIFPAQIALLAWRGAENGYWAVFQIGACFVFLMGSCLFAPLVYFLSSETRSKRLRNAIFVFLGSVVANLIILPSMMDIGLFSGAGMLKLRDARVSEYILDGKDYPRTLFSGASWTATVLKSADDLYSVRAFRQFQFGDVLLLCPGRYAGVPLKSVDRYSTFCVSLSAAKVRFSSLIPADRLMQEVVPRCLVPAPVSATIPKPIASERRCALSL